MVRDCPCGRLHETRLPDYMVTGTVMVKVPEFWGFEVLVPRAWIAFHGLKAQDLPELAQQYGWTVVK